MTTPHSVRIVGTGLLGASLGMALQPLGVDVTLDDASPTMLALARDLGAGREGQLDDAPELVVVATPPDVTARMIHAELERFPQAVVTDVSSVKGAILAELQQLGADLSQYVGSHPMAGRERSGAIAARGDLFSGRPWVICPGQAAPPAQAMVHEVATMVGASPVVMDAAAHDEAVARLSHVPQVAASLVAARLIPATQEAVGLAGQGIRDVTRIAASDPALWVQILGGNAQGVATVLRDLAADLGELTTALERIVEEPDAPGARAQIAQSLEAGVRGQARIAGKHGAPAARYAVVTVLVPDEAGALGRLFAALGEARINVEELRLEHVPGRLVGLLEMSVVPSSREPLRELLIQRGWQLAD